MSSANNNLSSNGGTRLAYINVMKSPWFPKVMFVSALLVSIASAIRIAEKLPAGRDFEAWSLMVIAMVAGMFLEKWKRPEEDHPDSPASS